MRFKNFITTSIFFSTLVAINAFGGNLCNAMFDPENEVKERKTAHVAPKDQKKSEGVETKKENNTLNQVSAYQDNSPFGTLSNNTLIYAFGFLKIEDLGRTSQVSSRYHEVCSIPRLWERIGLENYGDYFSMADFLEKPKEKVIHHYLSVKLNVLDTEKEASVSKTFKGKYDLISFTPYFKAYLPSAVNKGHGSFSTKVYGEFEVLQDIEKEQAIEKLRRERDDFIKLAKSEAITEESDGSWYLHSYYSDYGRIPNASSYAQYYRYKITIPKKSHLLTAREANEKLIDLGDAEAVRMKKEQLTETYSQLVAPSNLYQTSRGEWDNFVKNSVDELCSKGYLFAFGWKIEWLLENKENGKEFIESMLENKSPIIRNMGHYIRVFCLKHEKLGYEKDVEKAVSYIKFYNIPF